MKSINTVWFLGDELLINSYGKYFQSVDMDQSFIRSNFETKMAAGYKLWNKSYISRIRNSLARAITENGGILPQYIIVMLDNELIRLIKHDQYGISKIFGKTTEWLAREIQKLITSAKDMPPGRSVRKFEPQVIWLAAPQHRDLRDNYKRK